MNCFWLNISTLLSMLSLVPDVIWSGVIASILTLSGVLISNKSNTNRLNLQLRHDATQKEEDRKAAIRREVYLEVAKEAVNASNYLASIANINLANVNIASGLQGYFVAAAKLMIVADMKTTMAVNELSSMYSSLALEVAPDVFKISEHDNMIKTYQRQYDDTQLEIKRILSAQNAFNEAPQPKDPAVFTTLQFSFQQQQNLAAQTSSNQQAYNSKKVTAQIEFIQVLLPKLFTINDQQMQVLIHIREELRLESNLTAMVEQAQKIRLVQQQNLDKLMGFLKNELLEMNAQAKKH